MKLFYLIIPTSILIFVGCSSTYRITDFKSKDEFYKDINKSINNREVDVTLKNDSTFTTNENGAQVNENFLSLTLYRTVIDTAIPTNEIKNIDYSSNFKNPSAFIKLKDGTTINAKNMKASKENIEFDTRLPYSYNIPINKVNEISYKTCLSGIITGFLTGTLTGGLIGATGLVFKPRNGGNPPLQIDTFEATIAGALTGAILGPIIGCIIGHHYNYEFK